MLIRSPHRKRVALKTGQPFQAGSPISADWTGQIMCPLEKLWWAESDLHSPLPRLDPVLPLFAKRARGWYGSWGSINRNGFTIDRIR